jgi:hypothetical protein
MDGREALANIVKISAMDALRMSGQKQQIKLKLKPAESATPISEPSPVVAVPVPSTGKYLIFVVMRYLHIFIIICILVTIFFLSEET